MLEHGKHEDVRDSVSGESFKMHTITQGLDGRIAFMLDFYIFNIHLLKKKKKIDLTGVEIAQLESTSAIKACLYVQH